MTEQQFQKTQINNFQVNILISVISTYFGKRWLIIQNEYKICFHEGCVNISKKNCQEMAAHLINSHLNNLVSLEWKSPWFALTGTFPSYSCFITPLFLKQFQKTQISHFQVNILISVMPSYFGKRWWIIQNESEICFHEGCVNISKKGVKRWLLRLSILTFKL